MAKKSSIIKKITGNNFNFWDLVLVALVVPYVWTIFIGVSVPDSGLTAVYFQIIGPALTYATITKWVVQYIMRRAKK